MIFRGLALLSEWFKQPKREVTTPSARPVASLFPTPFTSDGAYPYTLVEQCLLAALAAIKAKPQWWEKINDDCIRGRWHKELVAGFVTYLSETVSWRYEGADDEAGKQEVAGKWAIALLDELKEEAASQVLRFGNVAYSPGPVEGTWMSDSAVSHQLKSRLEQLVAPLEQPADFFTGQPVARDYHPGSNEQVVDLVHPSLYPYVYGFSRQVSQPEGTESIFSWKEVIGTGKPRPGRSLICRDPFLSTKFQWLPSEVDVVKGEEGAYKARFRSYINNLHPEQHLELYQVLEEILALFVPMFEKVLVDMLNPKPRRHEVCMWEDGPLHGTNPYSGDIDEDTWEGWHNDHVCNVRTDLGPAPELQKYNKNGPTSIPPKIDFAIPTSRLQVIVKLATIELTPEKPSYSGGAWHVEGMKNESIVATGIYYWHSENVGDDGGITRLSFRTNVCVPDYAQYDTLGVRVVYGLEDKESLIQPLGSVPTIEGRALAWPNTLQHQVQPFHLIDPTMPGFRKILVYFLVDPTKRIVSTADVPPQQEEWYVREQAFKRKASEEDSSRVNPILRWLGASTDFTWPFPHKKALAVRKELMDERKYFTDKTMKEEYERPFSLCEH